MQKLIEDTKGVKNRSIEAGVAYYLYDPAKFDTELCSRLFRDVVKSFHEGQSPRSAEDQPLQNTAPIYI